jgi:hypothetical protein
MRYVTTIHTIILLHCVWGILLLSNAGPLYTTSIDGIVRTFQPYWLAAFVLIGSGTCGIIGMRMFENYPRISLAMFMPMQFLLLLSKLTVIQAIYNSHFADGVIRSREFIAADQVYILIIGSLYTWALLINYGGYKFLKR